jgi:hypothetical protein
MAGLGRAGTKGIRSRRHNALDDGHLRKMVPQDTSRGQAGDAAANHDGMLIRWVVAFCLYTHDPLLLMENTSIQNSQ